MTIRALPVALAATVAVLAGCGDLYPEEGKSQGRVDETPNMEEEWEPENYTPAPEPAEPTTPVVDTDQIEAQIKAQLPIEYGYAPMVICPSYGGSMPQFDCKAHYAVSGDILTFRVEVDQASGTWTWYPL